MVNLETFLIGLLATSVGTSLVTEAIKVVLTEHNKTYRANTLAGIVAAVLAAAISTAYVVITGIGFTSQVIVCMIGLIVLGWICAMIGYDKVIQAIAQFTSNKKG